MRFNEAPTAGYEGDVGAVTTHRVVHASGPIWAYIMSRCRPAAAWSCCGRDVSRCSRPGAAWSCCGRASTGSECSCLRHIHSFTDPRSLCACTRNSHVHCSVAARMYPALQSPHTVAPHTLIYSPLRFVGVYTLVYVTGCGTCTCCESSSTGCESSGTGCVAIHRPRIR
jgi:hypothetical protein